MQHAGKHNTNTVFACRTNIVTDLQTPWQGVTQQGTTDTDTYTDGL